MADLRESRALKILVCLTLTLVSVGAMLWRLEGLYWLTAMDKAALIGWTLLMIGAWVGYIGYLGRKSQRLQASSGGLALRHLITIHVAAMLRDIGDQGLGRDLASGEATVILEGISHEIWLHFIAAGLLEEDPEAKFKRRTREAHGRLE